MTPDQVRKLKQSGASNEDITKIEAEDVQKEQGVSLAQAKVIAKVNVDNALSQNKPIPEGTIDPRTGTEMTWEDWQENIAASQKEFDVFANKSKANIALRDAAFKSNDPKEIAKAIESSKELQNTANEFADFISDSPLGEQRITPSPWDELTPDEQEEWTMPPWVDEGGLPPKDDPYWKGRDDLPFKKDGTSDLFKDKDKSASAVKKAEGERTGILPQVDPEEYWKQLAMTPDAAAQAMINANLQNVAPIFQTPFKDYLGTAARNFQLFNPSGEVGSKGFLDYLSERESLGPRSSQDIWGQVQSILSGRYNDQDLAASHLGTRFGIGLEGADAAQQRQQLAMNLLSQDVNPLYRDTYRQIMARDMARAQMKNPIWQDKPLAWAAYRQTGDIPQTIENLQPTLRKSIQSSIPYFNSDGTVSNNANEEYGYALDEYNRQTRRFN